MSEFNCDKCGKTIDVVKVTCGECNKADWQRITPDNLPPEGVPVWIQVGEWYVPFVWEDNEWWEVMGRVFWHGGWQMSALVPVGTDFHPTHYHPFPELEGCDGR